MQAILLLPSSPPVFSPLTQNIPMSLLPILNRPLIEYFIINAAKAGLKKIHLISNETQDGLRNQLFQDTTFRNLTNDILIDQSKNLRFVLNNPKEKMNDTFWLCNTRYFHLFDWSDILQRHLASKKKISVVVTKFNAVKDLLAAEFDESALRLTNFFKLEKSSKTEKVNLITELFICDSEVIKVWNTENIEYSCPELLKILLKKNIEINVITAEGIFEPLSNLHYYWALNLQLLQNRQAAFGTKEREIANGIFVGNNTKIKTNLNENIQAPVLIGENCKVSKEVFLKGPLIIGNNVKIARRAVVDHSIVLDNTYIGQSVELKNSIVFQNWYVSIKNLFGVYVEEEFILGKNFKYDLKQIAKKGLRFVPKGFNKKLRNIN